MSVSTSTIQLPTALIAASILAGTPDKTKKRVERDINQVLKSRLNEFNLLLGSASPLSPDGTDHVLGLNDSQTEEVTGDVALWTLLRIESGTALESPGAAPSIGVRDMANLRALVAIVFRWAVQPRLARVLTFWAATSQDGPRRDTSKVAIVQVDDADEIHAVYETLLKTAKEVLSLILSVDPIPAHRPPNFIGYIISAQHVTILLKLCIAIGWGPEPPADLDMQQKVHDLLDIVPASQSMASLGSIVPQYSQSLPALRSALSKLLSQQLLRPDGIRGLCSSMLGDADAGSDAVPLVKLESIARVVSSLPSGMNAEDYYKSIVPRVVAILSTDGEADTQSPAPQSHKRAAAFTIARMLTSSPQITLRILSPLLHAPFFPSVEASNATRAIGTLQTLFAHSDPSPALPTYLLSPIIAPLFALLAHLDNTKTADPALKEAVRGLVRIWGRTIETEKAVRDWWTIIISGGGWADQEDVRWEVVGEEARVCIGRLLEPSISLLPTTGLDALANGDGDNNALGLEPNPDYVVKVLKTFDRKDVSSSLFVRALDEYQALNTADDANPMRTLLMIRLVMAMVDQLGSTVLTDPQHILSFISHALRSAEAPDEKKTSHVSQKTNFSDGLRMADLRIVDDEAAAAGTADDDDDGGNDSDDETPDDYVETALGLLLATLEANEAMTPLDTPLLQVILSDLEPLTLHASPSIRPLAREARLVLTARSASSSTSTKPTSAPSDPRTASQETYQQALKLLQDPILPVRAHGLVLLRQLITGEDRLDPALVPAILSIFLQSVQEDDSYIFLNSVKGLVAMVDRLGREILKGLMDVYAGGLLNGGAPPEVGKAELDKRVRVGEALNQSIRKCGNTLSAYADMLVPPLFHMVRSRDLPTTLRMSALSLLGQCGGTSPTALLPWTSDLCAGLVELVQLEGVSARPQPARPDENEELPSHERKLEPMESAPLSKDAKLAPFRRSALHFLATLLKSTTQAIVDERPDVSTRMSLDAGNFRLSRAPQEPSKDWPFPQELIRRMQIVLGYTRATDADDVVRVMAGEVLELLGAMASARPGV